MGLMDLARGGGEGDNNIMSIQGGRRRGGGKKNNSSLVQRYLAAIDGEAIEVLLPASPKSRRQQPLSPSGRSRSSHTTKSTKHTVRTAGSDSAVWNEVLTPSSSATLKSRRKLQPSQQPVSHKEDIAERNRQSQSAEEPSSTTARNVASSPSNGASPLRGLFPRSLLRNSSSQQANATTKQYSSKPSSLIRKWNTDHLKGNGLSTSNVSMTASTRPIPSSTRKRPQRPFGRRNNNTSNYRHQGEDDDDSSLTSRRTTESKESPYRDPRRGRTWRMREDEDDDDNNHDDDYDETSSYDENDEDEEESTRSGNYRIAHHPQQQKLQKQNGNAGSMNQFSIEKTFDQAVESGLDMILNTNAWTCAAPQLEPQLKSTPSTSTPSIPRSARDTQQMSSINTGTKPMVATTPPAHQRRKQRHDDALLRHTLSADTPRSDVTGAATEIATNRAIDIAMKRIRGIEYNNHNNNSNNALSQAASPVTQPEPPETHLTTLSNKTTASRVKQVALNFEQIKSNCTTGETPLVVNHQNKGLNRRTYENTIAPSAISNNGRLGEHFHVRSSKQYSKQLQIGEGSVETLKSLSSSVGVEIDDRVSRVPVSSTLKAYVDVTAGANTAVYHAKQQPNADEEDWTKVPLPYGPENSNAPKRSAARPPFLGRTVPVRDTIPSAPSSARYKLPSPSIGLHKAIDPCMSPPQIVRKSHSYDQMSPDPVFCSKSMSMSINSPTLFSPQQSSNASIEVSFQSEDAMFMERLDESVSTVASRSQCEAVPSVPRVRTLNLSTSNDPPKVTPEFSGRTDTTCDTHTDDEGTHCHDNEEHSPYMEILGIRGRFPTSPVYYSREITTPQQLQYDSSPQVCETRLVPLVPLDSPSPPPLIDDTLNFSREYHTNSSFNDDQMSAKLDQFGLRRLPHQKSAYREKTIFHPVVAKPEPIKPRPNQFDRVHNNQSSKYSGNSALATKLSRTVASLNEGDVDVRSVGDVKSIRSAFESIMGSHEAAIENVDDDDDVASVRSLRERFEPPPLASPTENGISRARAIFERNNSKSKSRPDVVANSHAGRILDRRVQHIDRNHRTDQPENLGVETENDTESVHLKEINSSFEQKPATVAERVRVFSGQNKSSNPYQRSNYIRRKEETTSSSRQPEQINTLPTELSFTSKRSPRNRMSSLRALGGKAFKCGPAKETSTSFDIDGLTNISRNSMELLHEMQGEAREQPDFHELHADETVNQLQASLASLPLEFEKSLTPLVGNARRVGTSLPTNRPPAAHTIIGARPLWMEQREKILSRSRNTSRVATAACESKRETALISSIIEKDVSCRNVEKEIIYVGDVKHTSMKGEDAGEGSASPTTNAATVNDTDQLLREKATFTSSNKAIDFYYLHPRPAYQLRRSASENIRPAYKLNRIMSENARPSEKVCNDQLLPFCLQPPVSNEEYVNTNNIEPTDDSTSNLNELNEEKKEDEFEGLHLTESSKASAESKVTKSSKTSAEGKVEDYVVPDIVHYKQNIEAQETRPIVIKPVARKPYVRPVPLKPLVKSVPVIPFGRSISDPTSGNLVSELATTSTRINDADSRFVPRALVDKQYATLELPRLVQDILGPAAIDDLADSASESSEFSDGVTLDLSIADVSNLTNPTALISKLGGHQYEEDQTRSEISSDERPLDNRNLSRIKRDNGGDAKQSEASSSQTSEAAAPLLARAMRTFPLSDDISTDSFFRNRANAAKKQWNTMSHSNRSMSSYALFEENSKDDESQFGSDLDGIWDIRQVESLFPTSGVSKAIDHIHEDAVQGLWQPFQSNYDSNNSPKAVAGNVSVHENGCIQSDVFAANATPSQSKTPTRRNTTRSLQAPRLNAAVLLPTLQDEIPENGPLVSNLLPSESTTDEILQWGYSTRPAAVIDRHLGSDASFPAKSTTSSNVSGRTNRTIVSNLLSSSISGTTSLSDAYTMKRSTTSTITVPASNKSTISTSTVSTYGPKHSALLARIHALKESRLRRASRMANHNRPSTALAYQISEQQHYYS